MPEKKGISQPSTCVCLNVRRASRAITRLYDSALEPSNLKVTQFSALMNIQAYGPLNITALSKILLLDRTTLIRNLKLLETAGLIENAPTSDPRERLVSLTGGGRGAIAEALPRWRAIQRQIKERIGSDNLAALNSLVGVLEALVAEPAALAAEPA